MLQLLIIPLARERRITSCEEMPASFGLSAPHQQLASFVGQVPDLPWHFFTPSQSLWDKLQLDWPIFDTENAAPAGMPVPLIDYFFFCPGVLGASHGMCEGYDSRAGR